MRKPFLFLAGQGIGMAKEIERRFLLAGLPEGLVVTQWQWMRQGYLAMDAANEVRVRESGDGYQLTVKHGEGISREEVDIPLTQAQFAALWPLAVGRQLEKRRLSLPAKGYDVYIDEYLVPFRFWLAEVEFVSQGAAEAFKPLPYFGPEVTDIATMRTLPALLERLKLWQSTGT